MSNEKEVSTVFSYKAPAIMITERNGDNEKVLEFATTEDYAAYKRIEAEPLIADMQKYDAALRRACEVAGDTIEEAKHHYWAGMLSKGKI